MFSEGARSVRLTTVVRIRTVSAMPNGLPSSAPSRARAVTLPTLVIVGIFVTYVAAFIWRSSFEVDGRRHFALFDDAMISMTYARNLSWGHGLVWNAGERVEGITNPLWTLFMAVVHILPLPPRLASLPVQLVGGALVGVTAWAAARFARRLGATSESAWAAFLLVGFSWPLVYWSVGGGEVALVAALIALALLDVDRPGPLLYAIVGALPLVRPDGVVPAAILVAWIGYRHRSKGMIGAGVLATSVLAQTLARLAYYGEWLPNTYFLKVTGYTLFDRVTRGALVTSESLLSIGVPLLAAGFMWGLRRGGPARLAVLLFAAQALYSVFVGGDAWEYSLVPNRYLTAALPGLLAVSAVALERAILSFRVPIRALVPVAGLFAIALAPGPLGDSLRRAALLDPPDFQPFNRSQVELAYAIRSITTPDAKVAVVMAGTLPYFAERPSIDLLGKSDPVIARARPRPNSALGSRFLVYPGHDKWNYAHSIGALHPDIVVNLWRESEEATPWLIPYREVRWGGTSLWFLASSERIMWQRIGQRAASDPSGLE